MKRVLSTLTVSTFALGALFGCGSTGSDQAAAPSTEASSHASTEATTQAPTQAGAASGEPTEEGDGATYTMAQVAQHKSAQSCWTVINNEVYDVTRWIGSHPGGAARIKGLCGIDGTSQFMGQHEGAAQPQERLAGFKIGTLAS